MDTKAKSMLAMLLGIVILIVDLLWLYGTVAGGGSAYGGSAYSGMDIAYGVIILVADLAWLYLDFSMAKYSAKKMA